MRRRLLGSPSFSSTGMQILSMLLASSASLPAWRHTVARCTITAAQRRTAHTAAAAAAASSPHLDALASRVRASQSLTNAYVTPFDATDMRGVAATYAAAAEAAGASAQPAQAASAGPPSVRAVGVDGTPLTVSLKDNFCLSGYRCSAASRMLDRFVPHYSSGVADRLLQAGAALTGKTNMDEFGMGSFSANSHYSRVINPYSFRSCRTAADIAAVQSDDSQLLSAGGSSGGSAAALASDSCDASIGSDTGGSIRLPAAYCGVIGLKPTYGRVSRYGLISYASSMDTPSIMAKNTRNLRTVLNIVEGFDPRDSTSVEGLPPTPASADFEAALSHAFAPGAPRDARRMFDGLTIGIPDEYNISELAPAVREAWHRVANWLREEGGARVVAVSLPHTRHALPAYYILAPAEAMSNLSRYDGVRYGHAQAKAEIDAAAAAAAAAAATPSGSSSPSRPSHQVDVGPPAQGLREYYTTNRSTGFGSEVQRRILVGSFVLSSRAVEGFYARAQRIRRAITDDFIKLFRAPQPEQRVHMLLTPTAVGAALSFAQIKADKQNDTVSPYLNDLFTIPSNLAGLPALSMPAALDDAGLPLGLQIIGDYHTEARIMDVAAWVQCRLKEERVEFDLLQSKPELKRLLQADTD